jgi:hypothetical protein
MHIPRILLMLALAAAVPAQAQAQSQAPAKTPRSTSKSPAKAAPPVPVLADADETQRKAADLVHYGDYACEFNQTLHVARHATHVGYANVRFGKLQYTMKPVLSTTGALRFEDVGGRALMIQIPSKSMLMDVRQGRRLVDECMHDQQRLARDSAQAAQAKAGIGIDPAKVALEAEAAAAAASVAAAAAASAASAAAVAASAAAEAASAVAPAPPASSPTR